jgi:hypothetical protein
MPIILLLLLITGLSFPRVAIFLLWFFSSWFITARVDSITGILAFLFMPFTLLWYTAVINWYGGVWGLWQLIFLVIAILFDVSSLFGSVRYYGDYYYED